MSGAPASRDSFARSDVSLEGRSTTTPAHDFWSSLDRDDAAALRERSQECAYPRGRTLFHEGQVPDQVLLIRAGVVKVMRITPAGREVVLAFRGAGELVGEQSAIDFAPRSATVVAVEPVSALGLTHQAFRAFLLDHPSAALVL